MAPSNGVAQTLVFLLICLTCNTPLLSGHQFSYKTIQETGGFSLRLIHRDSHLSPFYNQSATLQDRRKSMAQRSLSHHHYLNSMVGGTILRAIGLPLFPSPGRLEFLTFFSLDYSPAAQNVTAVVDTSSSFTWVQCIPCIRCFPQDNPYFDPRLSYSFYSVPCSNKVCEMAPQYGCNSTGGCKYSLTFGDNTYSNGVLVTDTIAIRKDPHNFHLIQGVVFGCAHNSTPTVSTDGFSGILGLGKGPLSLISQVGTGAQVQNRFSYCMGMLDGDGVSDLLFGNMSVLSGGSTPMLGSQSPAHDYYFLNLVDITVGNVSLNLPQGTFLGNGIGGGGIIIDSGAMLSYMRRDVYQLLEGKLAGMVSLTRVPKGENLCFAGTVKDLDDGKVPVIVFLFQGLPLQLNPLSTFRVEEEDVICFNILPTDGILSSFGSFLQQNVNVGYDLAEQKIYMNPTACRSI